MEQWRPIKEHPGYMVSTEGRVFSLKRGRYMKQRKRSGTVKNWGRSVSIELCLRNRPTTVLVARLVLTAFRRPPKEKEIVRYLDDDYRNVRLENLAWETLSEQMRRVSLKGKIGPKSFRQRVFALATDPTYEMPEYE